MRLQLREQVYRRPWIGLLVGLLFSLFATTTGFAIIVGATATQRSSVRFRPPGAVTRGRDDYLSRRCLVPARCLLLATPRSPSGPTGPRPAH